MSRVAIVWFRRDLRLADHPALARAREENNAVIPVFIWDDRVDGRWTPGAASRWWLHHSLAELDQRLCRLGSRLILAVGNSTEVLSRLCESTGARSVYWNRLYEPACVQRDHDLKVTLEKRGLQVTSCHSTLLFEPRSLLKDDGNPYQVFTPFWKRMQSAWQAPRPDPEPRRLRGPVQWPQSSPLERLELLPDHPWTDKLGRHWTPGEVAARTRLELFVDMAVAGYHAGRDRPDQDGTSRLSPYLHFGELSPGQVVRALDQAGELPNGQGAWSFLREIAWREFSAHLLFHHPDLPDRALKSNFARFPWRSPDDYAGDLDAWRHGRTGVPMVDAGMRQLWASGWMHNRVRMVVASFLTKNLLIPWQEGACWFWDTLVDADLANNTQGWQWTAGCGADAAPYFRVFNPIVQGQKFDPHGDYVRSWCPELKFISGKDVHDPVVAHRCGQDYRPALVDLAQSRRRALDAYAHTRNS